MRKIHPAFVAYTNVVKSIAKENPGFESDWPAQAINNPLNLDYGRKVVLERSPELQHNVSSPALSVSWPLWVNKSRLCKWPHDRVYSALGITGDFRRHFKLRYHYPIEKHNRNVVRAFVAATNSFEVILHSQHIIWLPQHSSWAPDWGQPERAGVFHLNGQRLRDAIPLSAGGADIPEESSLLHVRGRILGTISSTGLEEDCLVGPMDSSKFNSMPVTLSGMSSPAVSRKKMWWVFRPEYELGRGTCKSTKFGSAVDDASRTFSDHCHCQISQRVIGFCASTMVACGKFAGRE